MTNLYNNRNNWLTTVNGERLIVISWVFFFFVQAIIIVRRWRPKEELCLNYYIQRTRGFYIIVDRAHCTRDLEHPSGVNTSCQRWRFSQYYPVQRSRARLKKNPVIFFFRPVPPPPSLHVKADQIRFVTVADPPRQKNTAVDD